MGVEILDERVKYLHDELTHDKCSCVESSKLYSRIYSLKMSICYIDEELNKLNFISLKDVDRITKLIRIKDSYVTELQNLELLV